MTKRTPAGKTKRRVIRLAIWAGALFFGAYVAASSQTSGVNGILLTINDAIGPATAEYVSGGLAQAEERGAPIVVLRIDTPGGLDASMRAIIRAILASPVPVASYVNPGGARAASAGTYILYASHVAAMTPGTNLGAATPVSLGGGLPFGGGEPEESSSEEDDTAQPSNTGAMEAKVRNDAVAYIRSLAQLRGRNADWAEKAVREAASLSANQALEENVVDVVARNMDDLLEQIDGRMVTLGKDEIALQTRGLALDTIEPDWRMRVLSVITNPNIAMILMMIGIYGLFFEFLSPGALYPGTIGAICLLIALYALAALPLNFAGLALILLGIVLMTAEAFTPTFGALGLGGVVAFVLGASMFIDTDAPGFVVSWPLLGGIAAASLAFTLLVVRMAYTSFRRKAITGAGEMIGMQGAVLDWKDGSGHVLVHGERWNARSDADLVSGQGIVVTSLSGLTLDVTPSDAPS